MDFRICLLVVHGHNFESDFEIILKTHSRQLQSL